MSKLRARKSQTLHLQPYCTQPIHHLSVANCSSTGAVAAWRAADASAKATAAASWQGSGHRRSISCMMWSFWGLTKCGGKQSCSRYFCACKQKRITRTQDFAEERRILEQKRASLSQMYNTMCIYHQIHTHTYYISLSVSLSLSLSLCVCLCVDVCTRACMQRYPLCTKLRYQRSANVLCSQCLWDSIAQAFSKQNPKPHKHRWPYSREKNNPQTLA